MYIEEYKIANFFLKSTISFEHWCFSDKSEQAPPPTHKVSNSLCENKIMVNGFNYHTGVIMFVKKRLISHAWWAKHNMCVHI